METIKQSKIYAVLLKSFGQYKTYIGILVILGFLGAILESIGIAMVIPLLSFVIKSSDNSFTAISEIARTVFNYLSIPFSLNSIIFFIIILFIGRAVALLFFAYIRAWINADFMNREMNYLLGRTIYADWPFLLRQKLGYIQNTLIWDVKRSVNLFDVITQIIQSFTGFFMYLVVAFSISPIITLITFGAGGILLFLFQPITKKNRIINEKTSIVEKDITQFINEHILEMKSIKAAAVENEVIKKGREKLSFFAELYTKNMFWHSLGQILLQPFAFIFIIILFGTVYKSPGFNFAAFAATIYLIQKIFVYLQSGQSALQSLNEFLPYTANVVSYKETIVEHREKTITKNLPFQFNSRLKFQNIFFLYEEGGAEVLRGVNFSVKKGETVGLMGASGAGKTSVADLLLRLFKPQQGAITIDDVPIENIDLKDLREHIGYVSHDIFLFNETIEQNIRFYNLEISDEEIKKAAQMAQIYDFIASLKDGFKTIAGERGLTLSAGQRQRIVLARVLVRQPDIIILDEATSALDRESEIAIQKVIKNLHSVATVIIIAHRVSFLAEVDKILVLDQGKIIEEGAPHLLLQKPDSYFFKIYHLQENY